MMWGRGWWRDVEYGGRGDGGDVMDFLYVYHAVSW